MTYEYGYKHLVRAYDNLPMAVFEVDARGEQSLREDANVQSVVIDQFLEKSADFLNSPITAIDGDPLLGFTDSTEYWDGEGYAVVVLDDGVDKNHPALAGKVIAEACFGVNQVFFQATFESLCPGGAEESYTSGSASNYCSTIAGDHGTMVAAAATMTPRTLDVGDYPYGRTLTTSGTAAGAKIIAVQINVKVTPEPGFEYFCNYASTCILPYLSLILTGMDYAVTTSFTLPIAAINDSHGGAPFATNHTECQASNSYYDLFAYVNDIILEAGIAPIVANGNDGDNMNHDKIASPACIEGTIAVGATNIAGTAMSSYSNNGPLTTLLAPGGDIDMDQEFLDDTRYGLTEYYAVCEDFWGPTPVLDLWFDQYGFCPMPVLDSGMWLPIAGTNSYTLAQGTSFAAPIVAGAFAVLREKNSEISVGGLVSILQNTGKNITDTRDGYTVGAKKLIQLSAALAALEEDHGGSVSDPETLDYGFIGGSVHLLGSSQNLVFKVNKDLSLLSSVGVDGSTLNLGQYSAINGSTIITLSSNYLNGLNVGNHNLTVNFSDDINITASFNVLATSIAVPNTGSRVGQR
jgi:subtilisin family serine protease